MKKIQELLKDLGSLSKKMVAAKGDISNIIGVEGVKFVADNFRNEGFGGKKWDKRKKETDKSKGKKVLRDTTTLKKSVEYEVTNEGVTIGVDLDKVPYAKVHNEGGEAGRSKFKMPERRFVGINADLERRIGRAIENYMKRRL